MREQYAAEPPAAAGIEEGLRTRDTLRLKPPPTADQMPPRARNIAAERQDNVLKGPQPGRLEATPEELGQMFGIEGDLSSGQVPPIPPEKVAVPGRGPLGGGSTPYRMFDISNQERRANVSQATKPDLKTRFFATLRRLLGNVGPGSPSQWAAEKINREALGTVGREISGMKASLTDDMWRISESLDRDKSGRVDPQMLQFRRMMKEVEGGTIAKLPAEWQPLARTLRSIYDQIGQIIKRTPGLDRTELIANYVSHYWKATPEICRSYKVNSAVPGLAAAVSESVPTLLMKTASRPGLNQLPPALRKILFATWMRWGRRSPKPGWRRTLRNLPIPFGGVR